MMEQKLKEFNIIPDVIPDLIPSKVTMKVEYENGSAVNGEMIPQNNTKNEPKILLNGVNPNSYYALFMIDPDAPTVLNPAFRQWRHWVLINIQGDNIESGQEISSYQAPDPGIDSGIHRYSFLLYKQPKKIEMEHLNDIGNHRAYFKVEEFAKEHGFQGPISCTFFQCLSSDSKIDAIRSDLDRVVGGGGIEDYSNLTEVNF